MLGQDDEELKASDNPFALVVLAAKRSLESRKDEEKRFRFKRELVRLMLKKGYERKEIWYVFRFLDGILALTEKEKETIIYNEMKKSEVKEVAYLTPFERIAMEKGMLRKARESVQDVLEEKFGMVPENIQQKLQEIPDNEILRNLHRQAIKASSLEEFSKSLQI